MSLFCSQFLCSQFKLLYCKIFISEFIYFIFIIKKKYFPHLRFTHSCHFFLFCLMDILLLPLLLSFNTHRFSLSPSLHIDSRALSFSLPPSLYLSQKCVSHPHLLIKCLPCEEQRQPRPQPSYEAEVWTKRYTISVFWSLSRVRWGRLTICRLQNCTLERPPLFPPETSLLPSALPGLPLDSILPLPLPPPPPHLEPALPPLTPSPPLPSDGSRPSTKGRRHPLAPESSLSPVALGVARYKQAIYKSEEDVRGATQQPCFAVPRGCMTLAESTKLWRLIGYLPATASLRFMSLSRYLFKEDS